MDIVLEGVGKDAEIETNKNGGRQSKSPISLHLIDPAVLTELSSCMTDRAAVPIRFIADYMKTGDLKFLFDAMDMIEPNRHIQICKIGKVLKEGAEKYAPNNWRLIPQEEHINHALIHIMALSMGDTQDDHLDHALCRLMMALATNKSKNFHYTEYVKE